MDNLLYQVLLSEIREKFAKKSTMVNTLAEILRIEKGAVYRRLRQEVPFTFNEIAVISRRLKISLDNMIGIDFQRSIPFELQLPNFALPEEPDYNILNNYTAFVRSLTQSENSEIASISNVLPADLSAGFHYLSLVDLFKWNFHYNTEKMKPFHKIIIAPKIKKFLSEYSMELKKFNKASYVFDNRIFQLFVDDIKYFNTIRLIEKDEIAKIKEDLLSMLDYLEEMAISGQFKETGNSVNLYISDIEVKTSYTYMETKDIYFSMVKMFILSAVTSVDKNTFEKMKNWIHSLIKISTLITLTNEKQRVLYFENQRKIVSEL